LINEASASGEWDNVDEMTFADAGVTGVTTSNVSAVIDVLDSEGTSPWTVSEIQAIVNSVIGDITKQAALDLINAASESGTWTDVNEITFADAGVTGVTSENLYNVQYYLDPTVTTHSPLPRTLADIQAIVDETIQEMMVIAIYNYLDPYGGGSRPTVEVFARAGITGVDASNLDSILDELSLAYQEAKWDPFGTPMSTKQDIQNVVDRFLTQ
jgi:hypothetical protein